MNLALPALVILLGLLPGVACFYGYFAGRFDKRTAGVSGVEELALYVLFAIPINIAGLSVWRWYVGGDFDFSVAAHLLAGDISEQAIHNEIATFFQRSAVVTAVSYLMLLFGSFILGAAGRRFVWACRLDTRIPHLRLRHGWFYVLQGRINTLPRVVLAYVDVLTTLPDQGGKSQTRLYKGRVADFEIASSGAIESLTLKDAVRGRGRGDEFEWVPIPSTSLVIMGSTIHSINVTYIALEQQQGWRHSVRAWSRSFMFQEP